MKIIKVYPRVWGFRWIQNVVANGPIRGFSLYLGHWQLAFELMSESECRCVRTNGETRFNINCSIHGKAP
jgi:hypothetical protein